MDYFFTAVLIIEAVIAAYWGFESLMEKDRPWNTKLSVFLLGIFSFMWSSGMGMVCIADNYEHANECRSVALMGAIGFIICFIFYVSTLSNIPLWFKRISKLISACGIPLWFFEIKPTEVNFYTTSWGTTYDFSGTPVTYLHVAYGVATAFLAFHYCMSLIRFGDEKSKRILGKRLMAVGAIFIVGVILDSIIPITCPLTSIGQFFTFALLVRAVMEQEDCEPTQSNVSSFIYSTLSLPVCMYNREEKLYFSNEATDHYIGCEATGSLATILDFAIIFGLEKSELIQFEGKRTEIQTVCSLNKRECIVHVDKVFNQYGDILGYMMSVDDIADQMELMRNIESRNRIKNNFLTNLAQEIRTPMNSIVGFTETMLKGDLTDEQRENLENIRVASYTTVETINEIVDFSKVEAGVIGLMTETYDMGKLLASVIRQVQVPVSQKKLELVTEIDENIPSVLEGDVARLREIFYSLVKNAVKYTQEGTITLGVKLIDIEDGMANIQIKVKDTGIGLHENDLDAIFSPYEQLNSAQYPGMEVSGITLYIVKGYVEMMHGTIKVKSVYREGSVFTVELGQRVLDETPIGVIEVEAPVEAESNIGDLSIHDVRVLVVDDNHINLKAVSSSLQCYGLQVDTADSGEKAIALCRRNSYPIIFMDQMMPLMDGVDTMMWIRRLSKYYEQGGEGKIVVLTAAVAEEMRSQMIEAGFDEYLKKPVDFTLLEDILLRYLPEEKITRGDGNTSKLRSEEAEELAKNFEGKIPGVDMAKGLIQCGGTKESYYEVLAMMTANCADQLRELQHMIEPGLMEYPIAIHGVKGACYSIGAEAMGDQARELEMAAKAGDYLFVQSHHEEFAKAYQIQMDLIYSFLCQEGFRQRSYPKDFKAMLGRIRDAASEFDIARIEIMIDRVKNYELPDRDDELCIKLVRLMAEVDLDGIIEAIDNYNKR